MKRAMLLVMMFVMATPLMLTAPPAATAQGGCVDTNLFTFNNRVVNADDPYLPTDAPRKDFIVQAGDQIYADITLQRVPDPSSSPVPYYAWFMMITTDSPDLEIIIDEDGEVFFITPDNPSISYPYDGSDVATVTTDVNGFAETVTIADESVYTIPVTDSYSFWAELYPGILNGTIYIRSCGTPPTVPPNQPLVASAACNGEDLEVTITSGDANFSYSITGTGSGLPLPREAPGGGGWYVAYRGINTLHGPDKWDNLTVSETWGDFESVNLGQFKCRPDGVPILYAPAHQAHITDTTPEFIWDWPGFNFPNLYRVFVYDNKVAALRTVDVRQNTSGSETSLILATPLPIGRVFWRVRGRINRVWSRWSTRYTLFIDLPAVNNVTVPSVIQPPNGGVTLTTPPPTMPAPPNPR